MAARRARWPTARSPPFAKVTTDGVVTEPSALASNRGPDGSKTATSELVVPRSMPTALGMASWTSLYPLTTVAVG
jgi:hypothetical protein